MDQLRGRVGRHTQSGGRQCQNWPDDQQQVTDLLNSISAPRGGADGGLGNRLVNGAASEALCRAISRFEDLYFPGQRSGYVDPNGKLWNQLLKVSGRSNQMFLSFQLKLVSVKTVSWPGDDEDDDEDEDF